LKSLHKPYLYVDYIRVYKWNQTENNKQNNTEFLNDRRNAIISFIIPVSLSIFVVVLIIIAFVYRKLKMNSEINASTHYAVYDNSELIDEQFQMN
jgi:ribose/xylose/arabinose/galactoside ABC-type transport system permease subunit